MAQKQKAYAASALRALTYRIAATPTSQLPRHVSTLTSSIWTCQGILSSPVDSLKNDGDLSVIVNRFKTQLTTLLQDRTAEGRWSAIVLVKTAIEAGGAELLSKSNGWVRSLLTILKKSDPSTTRALAVLTLTRIFMLTWDYSNLIREITTPALPTFISTCLSNAENARCSADELQGIIESFKVLIPQHPNIFRTNESAITGFLLRILSSTAQDRAAYTVAHISTAQELLALLPLCVPKQGGATKWEEDLQHVVKAAHETSDSIFSPVIESWKSNVEAFRDHASVRQVLAPIEQKQMDTYRLGAWSGIYAGAERLSTLLGQIGAYIDCASPNVVNIRIGMVVDLLSRLTAVTVPGMDKRAAIQFNPQVAKEQRESLFAVLPGIHSQALQLADSMLQRLDAAMLSGVPAILEMLVAVFAAESYDTQLRSSAYALLKTILACVGQSLSKDEVADLTAIASSCCSDCESHTQSRHAESAAAKKQTDLVLAMVKTDASNPVCDDSLHYEATTLLPLLLLQLDAGKVPLRVRTQLDRTAILTQNKHALLASVLNPAPSSSGHGLQTSLLPFLARLFPNDPEVEALIRPRMPAIGSEAAHVERITEEEDEMEDAVSGEGNGDAAEDAQMEDEADELEVSLPSIHHTASKHTLDDNTTESESKRPRPATASSQIRSEWQAAMESSAREALKPEKPAAERTIIPAVTQTTQTHLGNDEDDGSDFEMPPLTMDSDTDDSADE